MLIDTEESCPVRSFSFTQEVGLISLLRIPRNMQTRNNSKEYKRLF